MNKTEIEYLDYSWNPIAMRCTKIGPGCQNCWHLRMADRFAKNPNFPDDVRAAYAGEGPPVLVEKRLDAPNRKGKEYTIGVQFMGDLFHESIPFETIRRVFLEMWESRINRHVRHHVFVLLTKRPRRVLEYEKWAKVGQWHGDMQLGVSIEDQPTADERIPPLLETKARVKIVSAEPLLGPVDLTNVRSAPHLHSHFNALGAALYDAYGWAGERALDGVIAGCESGPGRRTTETQWLRDLRDQCKRNRKRLFLKQREIDGKIVKMPMLDGQVWDQLPERNRLGRHS